MANKSRPAQGFVPIKEIRNDVVVLKNGAIRAVLMASSLNFALKSADEQNAIIMQFQNFLNSLEFPLQFHIQSRDLDIRPYIALLEERHGAQVSDLMKIQTREYIDFIKGFVENVNIMSKGFFIVVPYTPAMIQKTSGTIGGIEDIKGLVRKGKKTSEEKEKTKLERFEENRSQLEQRVSVVEQGLSQTGIRIVKLGTEELVELFYKTFNPGELGKPIPVDSFRQ